MRLIFCLFVRLVQKAMTAGAPVENLAPRNRSWLALTTMPGTMVFEDSSGGGSMLRSGLSANMVLVERLARGPEAVDVFDDPRP